MFLLLHHGIERLKSRTGMTMNLVGHGAASNFAIIQKLVYAVDLKAVALE